MNKFLGRMLDRGRATWVRAREMARHPRERKMLWGLVALGLGSCSLGAGTAAWTQACVGTCPRAAELATFAPQQASLVLDARGGLLGSFHRERRTLVPLNTLPGYVPMAFVAIEDRRFFVHDGIDPRRMVGAVVDNVREGFGASGGSTITMQLARNLFPQQLPAGEKTFRRKIAEVRLALDIERTYSKRKILELYLNHIYLGAGAYGVEAAARTYFNKPAAQLTALEAATLAGLPKAPSFYNPRRNPDAAQQRRNLVLAAMADVGVISPEQAGQAQQQPLTLSPPRGAVRAPYFVEAIRNQLEDQFGELLYTGGLRIHTALDPVLQTAAEQSLEAHLRKVERGLYGPFPHVRYDAFTARLKQRTGDGEPAGVHSTPYVQGIVVVMDPQNGNVRALVGGRDFQQSQFNRATQALRQPGSAFKPFVYATALEKGRSPLSRVSDAPITIGNWSPRNHNNRYGGPTTLRVGLRYSKNMVAIRLGMQMGIKSVREVAERTGLETPLSRYGPVFIGASAVYPLDIIAAYGAFANGGFRVEPRFVVRILDNQGRLLWEPPLYPRPAIDPGTSWILTDMLREVVDEGSGWEVRNIIPHNIPAAGKTGTTNSSTDNWFIGYTPDLLAGVWVGLDNPRQVFPGATGGLLAVPVWGQVVKKAYEGRPPPEPWQRPPSVAVRRVAYGNGKVVTEDCPYWGGTYTDFFVARFAPAPTCEPPPLPERFVDPTPHLPGAPVFPGQPRPTYPGNPVLPQRPGSR